MTPAAPHRLGGMPSGGGRARGPGRLAWAGAAAALAIVVAAVIVFVAVRGPHAALNLVRHGSTSSPAETITTSARPAPIVYRPAGYGSRKLPLVIALYGYTGCPQCMEGLTNFESLARQQGFVVAYPGSTTSPPWNSPNDLSYMRSFVDGVIRSQNIDPSRVYLTGFSAGGRAAYQYGCALQDKLAAIAIVSSVMRGYPCPLRHPVSELAIAGSTEHTVLYGNSNGIPSAAATAARWRALDGCPASGLQKLGNVGLNGIVQRQQWGPCANGSQVGLYVVAGGYHTWPGTSSARFPDTGYNASLAIWQFFAPLRASSLRTPDAALSRAAGSGGRVRVTLRLGEPVSVKAVLRRGRRTLVSVTKRLSSASATGFTLAPRKAGKGVVRLTLTIRDSYGRSQTIVRSVRLG